MILKLKRLSKNLRILTIVSSVMILLSLTVSCNTINVRTTPTSSISNMPWQKEENGRMSIPKKCYYEILIIEQEMLRYKSLYLMTKETINLVGSMSGGLDLVKNDSDDLIDIAIPGIRQYEFSYGLAKQFACLFMSILALDNDVDLMSELEVLELYKRCLDQNAIAKNFYVIDINKLLLIVDSKYKVTKEYSELAIVKLTNMQNSRNHFVLMDAKDNVVYDSYGIDNMWIDKLNYQISRRTFVSKTDTTRVIKEE